MLGKNGIENFSLFTALAEFKHSVLKVGEGFGPNSQLPFLLTLIGLSMIYAVCAVLPNSNQIMKLKHPWPGVHALHSDNDVRISWYPGILWGFILGLMFGLSMLVSRQLPQQFLYWKF